MRAHAAKPAPADAHKVCGTGRGPPPLQIHQANTPRKSHVDWELSADKFSKLSQIYESLLSPGASTVAYRTALRYLQQANFSPCSYAKICTLVAAAEDIPFTLGQFICAVHIADLAMAKNVLIPTKVPVELTWLLNCTRDELFKRRVAVQQCRQAQAPPEKGAGSPRQLPPPLSDVQHLGKSCTTDALERQALDDSGSYFFPATVVISPRGSMPKSWESIAQETREVEEAAAENLRMQEDARKWRVQEEARRLAEAYQRHRQADEQHRIQRERDWAAENMALHQATSDVQVAEQRARGAQAAAQDAAHYAASLAAQLQSSRVEAGAVRDELRQQASAADQRALEAQRRAEYAVREAQDAHLRCQQMCQDANRIAEAAQKHAALANREAEQVRHNVEQVAATAENASRAVEAARQQAAERSDQISQVAQNATIFADAANQAAHTAQHQATVAQHENAKTNEIVQKVASDAHEQAELLKKQVRSVTAEVDTAKAQAAHVSHCLSSANTLVKQSNELAENSHRTAEAAQTSAQSLSKCLQEFTDKTYEQLKVNHSKLEQDFNSLASETKVTHGMAKTAFDYFTAIQNPEEEDEACLPLDDSAALRKAAASFAKEHGSCIQSLKIACQRLGLNILQTSPLEPPEAHPQPFQLHEQQQHDHPPQHDQQQHQQHQQYHQQHNAFASAGARSQWPNQAPLESPRSQESPLRLHQSPRHVLQGHENLRCGGPTLLLRASRSAMWSPES